MDSDTLESVSVTVPDAYAPTTCPVCGCEVRQVRGWSKPRTYDRDCCRQVNYFINAVFRSLELVAETMTEDGKQILRSRLLGLVDLVR